MRPITTSDGTTESQHLINLTEKYAAHNYAPYPVVIREGLGVWVTDADGKQYIDMLAAYSALNFGHRNPRIQKIAHEQLDKLTLTSRAFYSEEFALLSQELAEFCNKEVCLFMNSGAEAVESAIKIARRWGYQVKGVQENKAEIICMSDNFHGRTTTIVSFSTSEESRSGFGPFTPGFTIIPYSDSGALEKAITQNTVAVLVEPVLGEGGIILPDDGFIKQVREITKAHNVLMIADEVQTGLCRTGKRFACDYESVTPDVYILGKSLGGGIMPISAVVGDGEVLGVLTPGSHGSTFGGNPLACAIAREVLKLIVEEKPEENSRVMGEYFFGELKKIRSSMITGLRGRGLFVGIDIDPKHASAKKIGYKLMDAGVLCKDTRSQTLRFAPPLVITKDELDIALERIAGVIGD